ncbi:Hypothetical protein, putative [Bodo saltans]|uniref:Uncharacterized protein n=1 Tax=Bodo saltans TaxID=75058 RepID=A0A0S4JJB6_BODSA|nr:Hypothetical protein, putative [Bodo saltans]|eukprot:CUG91584.1 Hypothetical protein, putative [Bodo saltans]
MSLPPELLNRVNKDLKVQLDRNQAELQRLASVTRLEQEVYQVTQQKLREAKQQFTQVQALTDTTSLKVRDEERASKLEAREVARLQQETESKQHRARDLLQKIEASERKVNEYRSQIGAAEEISTQNEEGISKWIEENRATVAATSQGSQILAAGDIRIKNLRREVELLKVQTRQMEEASSAQNAETTELRKETDDAIQRRLADEREALRVRSQIADTLAREEEIRMRKENHQRKMGELELALVNKRLEMDAVRQQLADEDNGISKQQRLATSLESKKNQVALALVREAAALEEVEAQARLHEVEETVLHGTISKKRKELAAQLDILAQQNARMQKAEMQRQKLEAELKSMVEDTTTADQEEQQTSRMLRHYAAELQVVSAAEERGRRRLQEEIASHRKDSEATDDVAQQLSLLRRTLRGQNEKEQVLGNRAQQLAAVTSAIDKEIEDVKAKIAIEIAKQAELGVEVRNAKKAQIEELREELAEWDRVVRQSKAAVDQARSMLGKDHRASEDIAHITAELEQEMKELAVDISRFQDELQTLAVRKADVSNTAESVFWQAENAKAKVAAQSKGLTSQLLDLGALEAQGRVEEMRLEGEQEARKIELHSQEEDRRRMQRRYQSASSQLELLRSRYTDLMTTMQTRLDREAADKNIDPVFEGKVATSSQPLEDAFADPEEIEARHVLLRALERDKLLNYGNSLDDQIVRVEKQLSALNKAVTSLRNAVQADHHLLVDASRALRNNGAQMQLEVASRSGEGTMLVEGNPLLLLQGIGLDAESLQSLVGDAQEEETFLQAIRDAFDEDSRQKTHALEDEVISWNSELQDKAAKLVEARAVENQLHAKLVAATEEKAQLLEGLRCLQRQALHELQVDHKSGLSLDARHRLFRTMLDKQRNVQSTSTGLDRTRQQHQRDALDAAVSRFQKAVVRVSSNERQDHCYFTFRQLCDKYGLAVSAIPASDAPRSAAGTRAHSSRSANVPLPEATSRPASRAFVSAMREVRFDPVVMERHRSQTVTNQRLTTQIRTTPPSTLNNLSLNSSRPYSSSSKQLEAQQRRTTSSNGRRSS